MEKNSKYAGRTANELSPFIPTHPGFILKEELECRGVSVARLAEDIGVSCAELDDVLNEKHPLSEKTVSYTHLTLPTNREV